MKIEIDLSTYDYEVLKRIYDYSEINPNKLAKGIIVNVINEFDSSMNEFIEKNLPMNYYE